MFIFFSKLTFFIILTETNFNYSLNHPLIIKNYASSWCWWQNMVDGVSNFGISHQHLQAFHSDFRKILAFEKFIEVMVFEDFIRKIWNSEVFIFFLRSQVGNGLQYLFHCFDFCFSCTKNSELPDQGELDLCTRQMKWNSIACQITQGKSSPGLILPFERHMSQLT